MITLHTRLRNLSPETELALDEYALLFNRVGHCLIVAMHQTGKSGPSFQREYLPRFGITARQFRAVRSWVEGLISNRVANLKLQLETLLARVLKAEKEITKLNSRLSRETHPPSRAKLRLQLHQKQRRLGNLQARMSKVEQELANPAGICFGSRKLFQCQFHLSENGFPSHQSWRDQWKQARSQEFNVMGSRDEAAGCQGCVAVAQPDGTFSLSLRLPNGAHQMVEPITFPYQAALLQKALRAHAVATKQTLEYREISRVGKLPLRRKIYPKAVSPLFWRFQKAAQGWRVFVSFTPATVAKTSRLELGAIGVDINADHLALAEVDRFGNQVASWTESCVTYGKSTEQAAAIIEMATIRIVDRALAVSKPLVLEKLNFQKKKSEVKGISEPHQARMLSSLSYRKIQCALTARAAKVGVEVHQVNPAYTSLLGRINYSSRYGLTVHQGAAIAIARRKMQLRETLVHHLIFNQAMIVAPDGRSDQVTFPLPARNRGKHVRTLLAKVNRRLQVELAAQRRERRLLRYPPSQSKSLLAITDPLAVMDAPRRLLVRSQYTNRGQHRSDHVHGIKAMPEGTASAMGQPNA